MKITTIIYRNNREGYEGSLITGRDDWRSAAAYYLTMDGYSIKTVLQADQCEPCNGKGQVKNGRRVGPLHAFKPCKACGGSGVVGELAIDATTITAADHQPYF